MFCEACASGDHVNCKGAAHCMCQHMRCERVQAPDGTIYLAPQEYVGPSVPDAPRPLTYRVLRILEYYYEDAEAARRDMAKWVITPRGVVRWPGEIVRSTCLIDDAPVRPPLSRRQYESDRPDVTQVMPVIADEMGGVPEAPQV